MRRRGIRLQDENHDHGTTRLGEHSKPQFGSKITVDRLEASLRAKGITVCARIDHAASAAAVGVPRRRSCPAPPGPNPSSRQQVGHPSQYAEQFFRELC
jgi:hypothetical protein